MSGSGLLRLPRSSDGGLKAFFRNSFHKRLAFTVPCSNQHTKRVAASEIASLRDLQYRKSTFAEHETEIIFLFVPAYLTSLNHY